MKNPAKDNKFEESGEPDNTDPKTADTDGDSTNDGDEVTGAENNGEATAPNDDQSKPVVSAGEPSGISSNSSAADKRCLATGLGAAIPLLFLIPVGLVSQLNIPGLKDFVTPIDKQIQALNTQLQKQAGLFQGPLAGQAVDAQLKRFGINAGFCP